MFNCLFCEKLIIFVKFDSIKTKMNMTSFVFTPGNHRDSVCGQRQSLLYIETQNLSWESNWHPKCPKKMVGLDQMGNPAGFQQALQALGLLGHFLRRLPGWTGGKSQGQRPRSRLWPQGGSSATNLSVFSSANFLWVYLLELAIQSDLCETLTVKVKSCSGAWNRKNLIARKKIMNHVKGSNVSEASKIWTCLAHPGLVGWDPLSPAPSFSSAQTSSGSP